MATGDYWGSSEIPQIPAFGALYPMGVNVCEVILAAGDSDGTPAATSDSDADFIWDTQETFEIINIEGGSDSEGPGNGIWVMNVLPLIVTAFTASVTMTIGDTDDVDGWAGDTFIAATASDQGGGLAAVDTDDYGVWNLNWGKYYPTSSGTVELVQAGADVAAGRMAVYALYFQCQRSGGSY